VTVFESGRGEKIIEKFIKKLNPSTIAKIAKEIDLLEQYGSYLGMPHSKKINVGLYELRIRGKEEVRLLYSFKSNKIHILNVFKKQTKKTPRKEVLIALSRLTKI